LSRESRRAALAYADQLSVEPFERLLKDTLRKPKTSRVLESPGPAATDPLSRLSLEKRRLLALRLRAQAPVADPWFPCAKTSSATAMRLFCFPYAGGGAGMYAAWAAQLPVGVSVSAARLPGREARLSERPFDEMPRLVDALAEAIAPYLDKPFALFGHSMGAAIAFELARTLRRRRLAQPACLFVSAARAPQLRRDYVPPPPPTNEELLRELRNLEGAPQHLMENKELMELTLPALRADTALYRNYVYTEEAPLDCPIRAYGGMGDERITRAHLEAWAEQTTKAFSVEMFPGGHFFPRTHQAELLRALVRDLEALGGSPLISPA